MELVASNSWPHQGHRLWASMPDAFWVYVFKVQLCPHRIGHEWKLCPYAHRGERARRRDPRRDPAYMAVACPDYRASEVYHLMTSRTGEAPSCVRGLGCRYAHGVFELWLHPERFRTRMCDAGAGCPRSICFFAHHPAERRREDDPVRPFHCSRLPPLPPPVPRSPRVLAPAACSPLFRPGMMMQTRSGEKLPLHHLGDDDGVSSSSSTTPTGDMVPMICLPLDKVSTSSMPAGCRHDVGASSSSMAIIADKPAPTPSSINCGFTSIGGGRHHADEDFHDFPHLDFIMDMLNSVKM